MTQTDDIDIAQFEHLSKAIGDQVEEALAKDRSDELREAYEDALSGDRQLRARFEATQNRVPNIAARLAAL